MLHQDFKAMHVTKLKSPGWKEYENGTFRLYAQLLTNTWVYQFIHQGPDAQNLIKLILGFFNKISLHQF